MLWLSGWRCGVVGRWELMTVTVGIVQGADCRSVRSGRTSLSRLPSWAMASHMTAQEARKHARSRAAQVAAERERQARERFEAELSAQRTQAKANENDLAEFYGAEAAVADAEERLAAVRAASAATMAAAAKAIAEREGSVSAAARLLNLSAGKVGAIIKAGAPRDATSMAPAGSDSTASVGTSEPARGGVQSEGASRDADLSA